MAGAAVDVRPASRTETVVEGESTGGAGNVSGEVCRLPTSSGHSVGRAHLSRCQKRRPEAFVSAAVFANDENAYTRRFQDWRRWLQMGILDVACPMAYRQTLLFFKNRLR